MKTTLIIEVETKDKLEVLPEEGETMEDYIGKEKELEEFQKRIGKEFHEQIINYIKEIFEDRFEEEFLDNNEDFYVEGWESLDDYGTTIKVKEN
jgi:hypothetical protein